MYLSTFLGGPRILVEYHTLKSGNIVLNANIQCDQPIGMLCYAIVNAQKPLVIIFINVLHSLTTIGTGNLNCNKWDTKLA